MSKKALPIILILILILLVLTAIILVVKNSPQTSPLTKTTSKTENNITQIPKQETVIEQTTTPTSPLYKQEIPLSIISPTNGSVVTYSSLIVKGNTAPKAEVFVNDKETVADTQGNFSVTLTLDDGENIIVVTANDSQGNSSEKELIITYNSTQVK